MPNLLDSLTVENGYLFRITHRDNVPWLLRHGLVCAAHRRRDPTFVGIGNPGLIGRRESHWVPIDPGGYLCEYVPFYFTPFSPMAYNIHTGRQVPKRSNDAIVILMTTVARIVETGARFVFTDRHAYLRSARYSADPSDLEMVDFPLLRKRDFQRSTDDPERVERYQAEFLVRDTLPLSAIVTIACYNDSAKRAIDGDAAQLDISIRTSVRPGWYFR